MFKTLTPLFALLISVGLFLTYVRPTLGDIKDVQEQEKQYADAITNAQELQKELGEKLAQTDAFTPVEIDRLDAMLPDSVDEVSTLLDLDALARTHRLSFSDITVKKAEVGSSEEMVTASDSSSGEMEDQSSTLGASASAFTPLDISFTLSGTYEDFRGFLASLEKSLVFYDVTSLEFSAGEGDAFSYSMTIRTYAFNATK